MAKATIAALREHPQLNATMEGDRLIQHEEVHLGIAVALGDDGLIVPVVRNAHELSHEGLAARIKDLAERARSKRLEPDEVRRRHVHDHQPRAVTGRCWPRRSSTSRRWRSSTSRPWSSGRSW